MIDLSVLIVSWNTKAETLACLRALASDRSRYRREIIVVDNGSSDGSAEAIAERFPEAHLIRNDENLMYSVGNNQAARVARGRYFALLNSDTEVKSGALDSMVHFLEQHEGHAAVAARLLNLDGTSQPSCRRIAGLLELLCDSSVLERTVPARWVLRWARMKDFDHSSSRDVEQPATAAFIIRASDWQALEGFDERMLVFFSDVDLCRRLKENGRRIHFLADAEVYHQRGRSSGQISDPDRNLIWFRDRNTYYRKHYGRLGMFWGQMVLRLYELEQLTRIKLGPRRGEDERAAMDQVRAQIRSVLEAR